MSNNSCWKDDFEKAFLVNPTSKFALASGQEKNDMLNFISDLLKKEREEYLMSIVSVLNHYDKFKYHEGTDSYQAYGMGIWVTIDKPLVPFFKFCFNQET
ncbi:hypothetical protein HN682_08010 [Candidatus Peregrinibacteria bacterium]|jgi:hypothetical protein|nr:hypothetical protein [Candidatus Peregrinibacteria bacterium]